MENDQEHFQVDRATGIVRVVRPLDYETSRQHTLKVGSGEGGGECDNHFFFSGRIQ